MQRNFEGFVVGFCFVCLLFKSTRSVGFLRCVSAGLVAGCVKELQRCACRSAAWPCPTGLTRLLNEQGLPGISSPGPGKAFMSDYSFVYNLVHSLLLLLSLLKQFKIL